MKRMYWLINLFLISAFILAACGGSSPQTQEAPSGGAPPTAAANVPEKTSPPPTKAANVPEKTQPVPVNSSVIDPKSLTSVLDKYVLRPDDLPNEYRVPSGGEHHVSNLGVIQDLGEVQGKRYIIATGRVDGWDLQLERKKKEDVAPGTIQSSIDVFESSSGAQLAISPEWFKAYKDEANPAKWVESGCSIGDNCLFYYYEKIDPATNLTTLQYDVAFVYKNVMVWVMGRGLDFDVDPNYVLNAAKTEFNKLEQASQASS